MRNTLAKLAGSLVALGNRRRELSAAVTAAKAVVETAAANGGNHVTPAGTVVPVATKRTNARR